MLLKNKAKKGGITVLIFTIIQTGTSLLTQVVLLRLIEPDVFGKLAMAMFIVMIFATIFNSQGDKYIIQTKENVNEKINVIITLELILAIVFIIIVSSLAPVITKLNGREDLTLIIQLLSLIFLAIPFQKIRSGLEKDLFMFKSYIAAYFSQLIGGILAVVLALNDFGIYALIAWTIATQILDVIALLFITKFRIKFILSKKIITEMYSFSFPIISASILVYFVWNVDYYIVAYFKDYTEVGYYWLAFQASHYLLNTKTMINSVLFPTFAHPKSNAEKYEMFDLVIRLTAPIYTLPALIILIFGKYFIVIIYGEKWLPALIPFKIFLIIVVVKAIGSNAGPLLYSLGKTVQDFKLGIINAITLPILVVIGTYYYGIAGAAAGVLVSAGLNAFYGFYKYIKPETKKSAYYYYHKALLLLSLVWCVLLIKNNLLGIDNLYFDSIFLTISCFVYFLIFRTELTRLVNIVFAKSKIRDE